MPTVRRSRRLAATPEAVWALVGDPHRLAGWWPRVERVEQVTAGRFTEVLRTRSGRGVRADFRLAEIDGPRAIAWEQEVEGTPFERVLARSRTTVTLAGADGGTQVRLELAQRMRGLSLFGGLLVRRAARRTLTEALDGLEALTRPSAS